MYLDHFIAKDLDHKSLGSVKNTAQLFMLFVLSNFWIALSELMGSGVRVRSNAGVGSCQVWNYGLSSIKPNYCCGQIIGIKEVTRRFVVTRGDGVVLIESGKKVLDQMADLVQMAVIATLMLAGALARSQHRFARFFQRCNYSLLCVVGLVSDDGGARRVLEQHVCAVQIMVMVMVMGLPGRQMKIGRVSQRIDRSVNLGAQATSAASNSLAISGPLFFVPALCWWALTMVESTWSYSLSASCAMVLKTRCHTPVWLQRESRRCATRKSPKRFGKSLQAMPAR